MTEDVRLEGGNELRRKAESMVPPGSESREELAGMSPRDIAKLVHELRVHQIELKMQNHELRRIQVELEKARDLYVHLYDFAPVAYFTLDEQGVTRAANLTAAALLGGQRSALVGRVFSEFILKKDQDFWYLHRRRILETGNSQPFQLRLRKKDGTEFYAELKSSNEELRNFTYIASHDLQEPLRKVKTFGDMLVERSENGFLDEVSKDYILRMQRAVGRMRSLLDSLLVYSRVSTDPGELSRTDLRKSVDGALSSLELMIEEKDARVEVGELPTVDAYPDQMIQVFQNLIENALKFRKEGETPRVSIYARNEGKDNRVSEICVQDNGIGFSEEYLDMRRCVILMADDDPDDRYIIGQALSALSTVVKLRVVEDGEDLMNYLRGLGKYADRPLPPPPELVLLDLNMARKGGGQALAEIKADSELKEIPLAIWTTSNESADRELCKEAGADSFVTKPESYAELSNRLRELVERYCVE